MLTGRTLNAEEGHAAGASQYLVDVGQGFSTAMKLAAKAASNTLTTNFAVLHALPRIFESEDSLRRQWSGPGRIFLFTYNPAARTRDLAPYGAVHTLATAGGKTVLTNR